MKNNNLTEKTFRRYKMIEFFIDWVSEKRDDCGDLLDIVYCEEKTKKELICEFLDIDYEDIKKAENKLKKLGEKKKKIDPIIRCTFPMSNFYIYEHEVPLNVRVSSFFDCESCEDKDSCKVRCCLITTKEK